jgi:proteasome activator subunit 4
VVRLFASDVHLFKISGLRKVYPRPLLIRRANLYHLQRVRSNAGPRKPTFLDEILLLDLATSSTSPYTETRRHAQTALESAFKVIIGSRPLVMPILISSFESSVQEHDYDRIKGAIYTLLLGTLNKTVAKDWRYTPRVIKAFINASSADKISIQKLLTGAGFQIMEYGRPLEHLVLLDEQIIEEIAPKIDVTESVLQRNRKVRYRHEVMERKKAELAESLLQGASGSHWKIVNRIASILVGIGLRFENLASKDVAEFFTRGAIDQHPVLRGLHCSALITVSLINEIAKRWDTNHLNGSYSAYSN